MSDLRLTNDSSHFRLSPRVLCMVAAAVALVMGAFAGSVRGELMLPPIVMLDALPEAPEGWELTDSRGRASISTRGGYSQAQRSYTAGDAVRSRAALLRAQEDAPMGPLDVRMQVFDTAGNAFAKLEFAAWRETGTASAAGSRASLPVASPGPGQAEKRFMRLAGHKVIATITGNGPLQLSVLVGERFIVKAEFLPAATIEHAAPWIAGIDARSLARYRHPADMQVRGVGELNLVTDELNPFTVQAITERGGEMQEIQRITRSFRTAPADMSKYEKEFEKRIARGEIPAEPTEEEYAETEKMFEEMRRAGEGGYNPEADVKAMQELGLLPKVAPPPAATPEGQ